MSTTERAWPDVLAVSRRGWGFVRFVIARFDGDHCLATAGALSYTTLLALVPLFAIFLSILSAFPFFAQLRARLTIARIKLIYGDVVTWGGDWRAKDYMHWEIKAGVTPAQVARKITALGITPEGVRTKNRFGRPIKPRG